MIPGSTRPPCQKRHAKLLPTLGEGFMVTQQGGPNKPTPTRGARYFFWAMVCLHTNVVF
jgi:hypothetical protein